eukprot:214898_1
MSSSNRLIDYFFVVGIPDADLASTRLSFTRPAVISRFPKNNIEKRPLPSWIARCCYPRGVRLSRDQVPPSFSTFVYPNRDRSRAYVVCLEVQERPSGGGGSYFIGKSLCFVSRYPCLRVLRFFLSFLYGNARNASIARILYHFMNDIPPPVLGQELNYLAPNRSKYLLARRSVFHPPIVEVNTKHFFEAVTLTQLYDPLSAILTEKRVLILSAKLEILTPVAEVLISIIFPLRWNHLYFPVMPPNMVPRLQSYRHPFIVGTDSNLSAEEIPGNCILFNLDKNNLDTSRLQSNPPRLPDKFKAALSKWYDAARTNFSNEDTQKSLMVDMISLIVRTPSPKESVFLTDLMNSVAVEQLIEMYRRKSKSRDVGQMKDFYEKQTRKNWYNSTDRDDVPAHCSNVPFSINISQLDRLPLRPADAKATDHSRTAAGGEVCTRDAVDLVYDDAGAEGILSGGMAGSRGSDTLPPIPRQSSLFFPVSPVSSHKKPTTGSTSGSPIQEIQNRASASRSRSLLIDDFVSDSDDDFDDMELTHENLSSVHQVMALNGGTISTTETDTADSSIGFESDSDADGWSDSDSDTGSAAMSVQGLETPASVRSMIPLQEFDLSPAYEQYIRDCGREHNDYLKGCRPSPPVPASQDLVDDDVHTAWVVQIGSSFLR